MILVAGLNRCIFRNSLLGRRRGNPTSRSSTFGLSPRKDSSRADFSAITQETYLPRSARVQRIASFALFVAIRIIGYRPEGDFPQTTSSKQKHQENQARCGAPLGLLFSTNDQVFAALKSSK
jgi:hypothetical protein